MFCLYLLVPAFSNSVITDRYLGIPLLRGGALNNRSDINGSGRKERVKLFLSCRLNELSYGESQ